LGTPSYNAWRLVSLSPLPRWILGLIALALLAGLIWTSRSLRRERRWSRRLILGGLRVLSALWLFALLTEPGLQRLQTARVKSRFLLLIDRSRSMAFPAGGEGGSGTTRAGSVVRWVTDNRAELAELADRFQLEVMGFAGEAAPIDLASLGQAASPAGTRTDLLGALKGGVQTGPSITRALAGALVISDGADNGQLQHGVGAHERVQLEALGAPVNTLAVGQGGLKDLAVSSLQVDDFAFVRNPLSLEVTLHQRGFAGRAVPVVLTRGGHVVASQSVTLDESGTSKVRLTFTPDQTGEFVYTVSVPVLPDEAVIDNNQRAFVLKVIRDRVRVLLVCGHPSWDERFLRGLLRQDPNVDLVSFFILRGVHDVPHASADELSLIPFPTEEIFRTQLHSFDLVILQDFAYRPFSSALSSLQIESYFPDIKRYVQGGGALLMIGGENSFGEGEYDQTELADVLPVAGAGLPGPEEPFKPDLTEEGRRHPVTQLAESGDQSARLWGELPPISGINLVKAKPGARVLLAHPLLSVVGENAPLLVVSDEGQGRSMALMTDSSWRWSFEGAGAGLGNRYYERFYTNAVRWLVRDPDLTPVKLSAEQRTVEPGQPAVFDVRARQADYDPAAGAQVTLTVFDAETEKRVAQLRATASKDGTARIEVPDLPGGAYRAVAEAVQSPASSGRQEGGRPQSLGQAEQALAVRESGPETDDPLPHPEILEQVAKATGGTHGALADGFPKLKTVHESEEVEIGRRKEEPLWDNGYALAVIAVLLAAEWFLRRRWGFA
jgi:uncharacterized membrane protein